MQSFAQPDNPSYRIYYTREGASNNRTLCMLKDTRGFLWMGSVEGLNRFDGHSFKHFFTDRSNPNSINDNYVWDILEFKPGKLLIATNNGVSILNTITNDFENEMMQFPALRRDSGTGVSSFFMDDSGKIWINHSGEIDVFDNEMKWLFRFTDLPWARVMKGVDIQLEKWYQDKQNRIWLPTSNMGLCIVDIAKQQVTYPGNNPAGFPFTGNFAIRSFLFDEKSQVVWFAPWGEGLCKYNLVSKLTEQQLFGFTLRDESRSINTIVQNEKGQLICGATLGIFLTDTGSLNYIPLNNISSLPGKNQEYISVVTHLKNSQGEIWMGGNALVKLIPRSSLMKQFFFNDYGIRPEWKEGKESACKEVIRTPDGNYYLSYASDGLMKLNMKEGTLKQYHLPAAGAASGYVGKMCVDANGTIWVSTSRGIRKFDAKTSSWQIEAPLEKHWKNNNIPQSHYGQRCLFADKSGNIWIGIDPVGIARYNPLTGKFDYFKDYRMLVKSFFPQQYPIHRIMEDEEGGIWFSSFHKGGLLHYQLSSANWSIYPSSRKYFNLLADKALAKVTPAGKHQLWVSSLFSYGLMKYDYLHDSITFITRSDGLLSDKITMINKDSKGNLVLNTDKGINYYNTATNEIGSYTFEQSGLEWQPFFVNCYNEEQDEFVFGMTDRVLVLKNNFLSRDTAFMRPVFDRLVVNSSPYRIGRSDLGGIRLNYTQQNISIDFTAIRFSDNNDIEFAYKLEGTDKRWKQTRELSTVTYTNLSPGNYRFLIRARNQSGQWGPVNDELKFRIVPAFWQTNWFWGLVAITGSVFLFMTIRRRIRAIRKEASLKQKITETEMQALRAQMNPHFIFNCLNAIDNLVQTNQKERATTYLARFARLIRSVLESSKNNTVPFQKDFEGLKLYLQMEQFRCSNKFEFSLEASEELFQGDFRVPPLLVQPFVENAIHHGLLNKQTGERKLSVVVTVENDIIKYTVTDNGVGRKKAQQLKEINKPEYRSYGIAISRDRIHLYNQNGKTDEMIITDLMENSEAAGTKVEVFLRIREK